VDDFIAALLIVYPSASRPPAEVADRVEHWQVSRCDVEIAPQHIGPVGEICPAEVFDDVRPTRRVLVRMNRVRIACVHDDAPLFVRLERCQIFHDRADDAVVVEEEAADDMVELEEHRLVRRQSP
jgi:hypothetical protein